MRWSIAIITFILTVAGPYRALAQEGGESEMSIGEKFHYLTGFGVSGYRNPEPHHGDAAPVYKTYPDAERVALPTPDFTGKPVETAIRERRSVRVFADDSLTLEVLSQLLLSANGVTYAGSVDLRSAPSGGALYPIETYVVVSDVESLAPGLYHFQVSDSSLELVSEGRFDKDIHRAAHEQESVGASPVTIILTARFDRTTRKYADRGYRYAYIEVGAICENIYLQAQSLDLGTAAVGAFNDASLNDFLDIDGRSEAAILIMPVGVPR